MATEQPSGTYGLWTVADVATFTKMSRSWVYIRARSGGLPSIRLGGALRFDPTAVLAYLSSQTRGR